MTRRAKIISTGGYLPEKIVTNDDLAQIVETSDEWITQRSGIKQRHIAAENQTTADMAIEAAKQALARSSLSAEQIDGIIVATTTPDQTFPAVAVKVQSALNIPVGVAFDVQAVCSGFIYALSVANSMIATGQMSRVIVIGAEKMSSILNWSDRATCVLFGDGAGAVILEANEVKQDDAENASGILSTHLYANGNHKDLLYTDGGVSSSGQSGHIVMHGREIFKHAVKLMSDAVNAALEHNNISAEDIDWLVPHQANSRIIEATAKKLKMPMDQVILTVQHHANTSAASIPLAFDSAMQSGKIKKGELVLFEALGGGLTWGSALVRI